MARRFKALIDFKSREFAGSQYVAGMTYTIRGGNKKLADMVAKWLQARLFKPSQDIELFGTVFSAGKTSYVLPGDSLEAIVEGWVAEGKAVFVDGKMISFDVEAVGGITGA